MHDVPHGLKPLAHPMYLHALVDVSHWPAMPFIVASSLKQPFSVPSADAPLSPKM